MEYKVFKFHCHHAINLWLKDVLYSRIDPVCIDPADQPLSMIDCLNFMDVMLDVPSAKCLIKYFLICEEKEDHIRLWSPECILSEKKSFDHRFT